MSCRPGTRRHAVPRPRMPGTGVPVARRGLPRPGGAASRPTRPAARLIRIFATLPLGLLLTLLPAAPAQAGQAPAETAPRLRTSIVVEGPMLRLSDLFAGLPSASDAAVARAPAPGRQVTLEARWLAAVARGHGLAWQPRSALDLVVVARASQTLAADAVEAALRRALAARGVAGDMAVVLDNPGLRLDLPLDAEPDLAVAGLSYDPRSGRFKAHVVAPAEGQALARAAVTGRALRMTRVPVLRRRVASSEVIGEGDIDWLRLRADRVAANVVVDPANLVGKSPRRAVRPGEPVRAADLRDPVMVPKNSLVLLRLATERMILTVQGRALEDGAAGQVIRVRNTKSHAVVNGVVTGSGTVVVPHDGAVRAR